MEDEGLALLTGMFFEKEWFCEAERDANRYVVYVKYMNMETMTTIPDQILGRQVVVHFIAYKRASHFSFATNATHVPFSRPAEVVVPKAPESMEELSSDLLEFDVEDLVKELVRLEKICGSNALADVFFEIHDKQNAVTNLSARYPEIRDALEKIYNEYGFDVIYDEIEL
jgi:hypothetical protein